MTTLPDSTVTLAQVPRKSPSAAWQKIDGEVVLLNVDGHELLGLNGIGGRVWSLIDGARTLGDLIALIAAEYPSVSHDQLSADVQAFLAELVREKLVEMNRSR